MNKKRPPVICVTCKWVLSTNLDCSTCEAERTAWITSHDFPFLAPRDQRTDKPA